MNENDIQKKITGKLESLTEKEESVQSADGIVTIYLTGVGDFKRVIISKNIDEIDNKTLEDDILEAINNTKALVSSNVLEIINETMEESKESEGNNYVS